jgi:hypothetical protein
VVSGNKCSTRRAYCLKRNFRVGVAIGQIFGGLALILKGTTGTALGGGASATGIGAS